MFLPLAERMVEKMVKEEKIEAEAEVSYSSIVSQLCFQMDSRTIKIQTLSYQPQ